MFRFSSALRRMRRVCSVPLTHRNLFTGVAVPPGSLLARASEAVRERPLLSAMASMTAKAVIADVTVQKVIEQRETIDRRRTATFAAFGCLWMGGAQYYIYSRWMEAIVVPGSAAATAAAKVSFDQLVYVPGLFLPVFFVINSVLNREPDVLQAAQEQYQREIWLTLKTTWGPSFAMQFVGFYCVPPHLRIPYVAMCSFVTTSLLSILQGFFRGLQEDE